MRTRQAERLQNSALHISCVTRGGLHSPAVSFPHTQPLLRLQPFATLDLVLNESQSNSNPQISESFPSLNSLDFYCQNQITSLL